LHPHTSKASDPRLAHLHETLGKLCAVEADIKLTLEQYDEATSQCSSLVHRAATGDLRVPSFDQVIEAVKEVYEKILPNKGGQNAQSVVFNLFGYTGESMNLLTYFQHTLLLELN
jgi:hypothetical protein